MDLIFQYLSLSLVFEVRASWSLRILYPTCSMSLGWRTLTTLVNEHLRTVSKDKLISSFCEHPFNWGDRQFTHCTAFAKGPRFINMVMTFVLHPLSHYNSIIKPRARFLLSLLEHLTIDFSSHSFFPS